MDLRRAPVANPFPPRLAYRPSRRVVVWVGLGGAFAMLIGVAVPGNAMGLSPSVEAPWSTDPAINATGTPSTMIPEPTASLEMRNDDAVETPVSPPVPVEALRTPAAPMETTPITGRIAATLTPSRPTVGENVATRTQPAAVVTAAPTEAPALATVARASVAPSPGGLNTREAGMLRAVNDARANAGLSALVIDTGLTDAARMRSQDMASKGYFSHVSPTGVSWLSLLNSLHIPVRSGGENLAKVTGSESASVSIAISALMDSPTHRANILGADFSYLGVGAVTDASGMTLFTTIFASR